MTAGRCEGAAADGLQRRLARGRRWATPQHRRGTSVTSTADSPSPQAAGGSAPPLRLRKEYRRSSFTRTGESAYSSCGGHARVGRQHGARRWSTPSQAGRPRRLRSASPGPCPASAALCRGAPLRPAQCRRRQTRPRNKGSFAGSACACLRAAMGCGGGERGGPARSSAAPDRSPAGAGGCTAAPEPSLMKRKLEERERLSAGSAALAKMKCCGAGRRGQGRRTVGARLQHNSPGCPS